MELDENGDETNKKFREKFPSFFNQMLDELTDLIVRDRDDVRPDALSKLRSQAEKSL